MKKNKTPEERLEMDILKDELEAFEAQDFDGISARAEIIPLITEDDESFLLHEDALPDDMPLLPLHGNVLFPGVVIPISVGRKASLTLLRAAEKKDERIIVTAQRNDIEDPEFEDLYPIGVIARVIRVIQLPRNNHMAILQGSMKCLLSSITAKTPAVRLHSSTTTPTYATPAPSTTAFSASARNSPTSSR